MKKLLIVLSLILSTVILVSCEKDDPKIEKFSVEYILDLETIETISVSKDTYLTIPNDPKKNGYEFIGWYMNDTKWEFNEMKIISNLKLVAKFRLLEKFIEVLNVKVTDSLVTWDKQENTSYIIEFLDKVIKQDLNKIDIKKYYTSVKEDIKITITPIKEGFTSVKTNAVVEKYNNEKITEVLKIDFEKIDLNTNFSEKEFIFNEYLINVKNVRLNKSNEGPVNDTKGLVIKDDGLFEILSPFKNLNNISFLLSSYNGHDSSKAVIEYSTDKISWQTIKEIETTSELVLHKVELYLKDDIYLRIRKINNSKNIIIDDISVNINSIDITDPENPENTYKLTPYYKSAEGLEGEELVLELRKIINTNVTIVSYGDARYILEKSDLNIYLDNEYVRGMYDDDKISLTWIGTGTGRWQREHVWPNSKLGTKSVDNNTKNQASDVHNLRAITGINQTRSNRFFTIGENKAKTIGTEAFYPGDDHKGDVARILMYMAVKYDFLKLTSKEENLINNKDTNYKVEGAYGGKLDILLNWHNEDTVDIFEEKRNDFIYNGKASTPTGKEIKAQGNRNPFIDHPELFLFVYNYFVEVDEESDYDSIETTIYQIDFNEFKKRYFQ